MKTRLIALWDEWKWLVYTVAFVSLYVWLYHHGYVSLPPDGQQDYFTDAPL